MLMKRREGKPAMFRRMMFFGLLCLLPTATHAAVWYVDIDNTSGKEDGTSWATAFTAIQPAIDAASADGGGRCGWRKGLTSALHSLS